MGVDITRGLQYKVIECDTHERLALNVKTMIDIGWAPQGGICSTWSLFFGRRFYQAMTLQIKD